MSDPLYRKELLRLAADAIGAGRLAQKDSSATIHNPACGDRITVDIALEDGRIVALGHHTEACVLTQASASILGQHAKGMNRRAMKALTESVTAMLKGGALPAPPFDAYGAFDGAAAHKGRHKCVLLPLEAALEAMEISEPAKPGA